MKNNDSDEKIIDSGTLSDEKNKDTSDKMAKYYKCIRQNPVPNVVYNSETLQMLETVCKKGLTARQATTVSSLGGAQSSQGFDTVQKGEFNFPKDHGPHPNIRSEWYYLACSLKKSGVGGKGGKGGGGLVSIVLAIKKTCVVPESFWDESESWTKYQVIDTVLGITLPDSKIHINNINSVWGSPSNVQMQATPNFVWKGGDFKLWSQTSNILRDLSVEAIFEDGKLNMKMIPGKFFLEGKKGCAPCINGLGYRYYSWPDIKANGTLTYKGDTWELFGTAWLDHQWTSRLSPVGYLQGMFNKSKQIIASPSSVGGTPLNERWNWFLIQLDDGTQLTTAKLAAKPVEDGDGPWKLSGTTYIDNDFNTTLSTDKESTVTYTGYFIDPKSGIKYPQGWKLDLKNTPYNLELTLTPTLKNQIIGSKYGQLWEGGVIVTGFKDGKKISGVGYAEMMGYITDDEYLEGVLPDLGIDTDKKKLFLSQPPPKWSVVLNYANLVSFGVICLAAIVILVIMFVKIFSKSGAGGISPMLWIFFGITMIAFFFNIRLNFGNYEEYLNTCLKYPILLGSGCNL